MAPNRVNQFLHLQKRCCETVAQPLGRRPLGGERRLAIVTLVDVRSPGLVAHVARRAAAPDGDGDRKGRGRLRRPMRRSAGPEVERRPVAVETAGPATARTLRPPSGCARHRATTVERLPAPRRLLPGSAPRLAAQRLSLHCVTDAEARPYGARCQRWWRGQVRTAEGSVPIGRRQGIPLSARSHEFLKAPVPPARRRRRSRTLMRSVWRSPRLAPRYQDLATSVRGLRAAVASTSKTTWA